MSRDVLAQTLVACYAQVEQLTEELERALELDSDAGLSELVGRRLVLIERAATLLEQTPAPPPEAASAPWDAVQVAAARVIVQDERLRARLSAQAQEIPLTLAALRGSRAALESYGGFTRDADSENVDRRG